MTAPDQDIVENVRKWVRYADDDLTYARYGLGIPGEADEVTRADAERAVELADLLKQTVRQWLGDGGAVDLP